MNGARYVGCLGAVALVVGCSLTVDLDGLAEPQPPSGSSGPDASSTTSSSGGSGSSSGGSSSGGAGGTSGTSGGDAGGCARFRVRLSGCDEHVATYFPNGGEATRTGTLEVIAIGQYEPLNGFSTRIVDNRTTPHVLVLSSYEDTVWQVVAKVPSAVTVLLSGYEDSRVEGVPGAPNEHATPNADEYPSSDASELFDYAMRRTGAKAVSAFGGCYELTEATIEDDCP